MANPQCQTEVKFLPQAASSQKSRVKQKALEFLKQPDNNNNKTPLCNLPENCNFIKNRL